MSLAAELDKSTRAPGVTAIDRVLSPDDMAALLADCTAILAKEPTLVEMRLDPAEGVRVSVVGDTHGQFHDVLRLMERAGTPAPGNMLVFNGDFIDRGAWGVETLLMLAAWKVAAPSRALLLRGNHESVYCASTYGFLGEMEAKLGPKAAKRLFVCCKRLFSSLPLGLTVNGATLVVHGGLFRKPPKAVKGKGKKRKRRAPEPWEEEGEVELGSLADLRKSRKGGMDPDGLGGAALATDVLWSDPTTSEGLVVNDSRGVGLLFGADATERFLRENGLRLIVRSHEGPDARDSREDGMAGMGDGWTLDHDVPGVGKLVTVFSAPDYPQFQDTEKRFNNRGAVCVLRPETGYCDPSFVQFEAVLPRPEARPYYDMDVPGSDDELDVDAMDNKSQATSLATSQATGDAGPDGGDEVGSGAAAESPAPGPSLV